jgi:type IV secretion system protein VirB3
LATNPEALDRDVLFVALTRPQMLVGVTYGFAIGNAILTTELFLVFKSVWVLFAALAIHVIGVVACLRDPRIFDLWLVKVRRCPRVRNYKRWRCNAYRP